MLSIKYEIMTQESILDCEKSKVDKLKIYQLPNRAKMIGWVITCLAFVALFFTIKDTIPKEFAKYSLLVGLLIVSISKEKIEDELIKNLRMRSFTFAFIFAVFIVILNPLFSYFANFAFTEQQDIFDGLGDWMVLWLLLSVQVLSFLSLKRLHQ